MIGDYQIGFLMSCDFYVRTNVTVLEFLYKHIKLHKQTKVNRA